MTQPTGRPDGRSGDIRRMRDLENQAKGLHKAYQGACATITAMHAAALGEVRVPIRGLVQDVQDAREAARLEIESLADLVASISHERSELGRTLVENQAFYEARIDQLLAVLRTAGIDDPGAAQDEAVTALPAEFYDELTSTEA